jgi:hypothetical protein
MRGNSVRENPFGVMISRIQAHVSHSDGIMAFLLSSDRDGQK